MRRREVLAGGIAAGVVGVGAAVALGGIDPFDDGNSIPAFELERIEATGSEAGTVVVPDRGTVTFVEIFATWCGICRELMEPMGAVYDAVGEDVQFVSVTNEPLGRTTTAADVADWWDEHGGRWTVAHDADLALSSALDAIGVPYSFVLDEDNVVTWSALGYKSVEELREPIDAASTQRW